MILGSIKNGFPAPITTSPGRNFNSFAKDGGGLEGTASSIINRLSKTISPNDKLSDLVLLWMLEGIRTEGGGVIIRQNMADRASNIGAIITDLQARLPQGRIGIGDMYANIFRYLPLWNLLSIPLSVVRLINPSLYQILLNPQDRVIPDRANPMSPLVQNQVYNYTIDDLNLGNSNIGNIARVGTLLQQDSRYPSRTFQNYVTYMRATGRIP